MMMGGEPEMARGMGLNGTNLKYGEGFAVNPNDIKLKENGELDIDNMTEEQLYAHMMRLQ